MSGLSATITVFIILFSNSSVFATVSHAIFPPYPYSLIAMARYEIE
jgi:hypothetical protein